MVDKDDNEEITYSKDHILDYVDRDETIKSIRLENPADWYLWQIKEKLDNSTDFIWKHYPTHQDARIVSADITIDSKENKTFRCKVTNPNPLNKPVFKDLESILNYSMTVGSKQNQYIITRGYLGDATKRIHAIGTVLAKEMGKTKWEHPMIFRFNGKKYESVLNVDRMTPKIDATPILRQQQQQTKFDSSDTEIDNIWPLLLNNNTNEIIITTKKIEDYIKCYSLFTTDITFNIAITDDRDDLRYPEPKVVSIDATTNKPISNKWVNAPSIYSYSLEQFSKMIFATHHKKTTTVYQFVKKFREWSQVSMSACPDLVNVSISDFLTSDPSIQDKVIRDLYFRLRREGKITTPPDKISLPYTVKQERKESLVDRLVDIYPYSDDYLDTDRAVYEITDGIHVETDQATNQSVQFPYAIEIVAIPFSELHLKDYGNITQESRTVVTAINYSVSPLGINLRGGGGFGTAGAGFAGFGHHANNILGHIFEHYGFTFESENNTQDTKIPCIFAINLITPKPTYMSEGKSDIDITPYQRGFDSIIKSISNRVRTFKSAKIQTPDLEEQREERESYRKERLQDRIRVERDKQRRREERIAKAEQERKRKEEEKKRRELEKRETKNVKEVVEMLCEQRYKQHLRKEPFVEDLLLNDVWYFLLPSFKKYKSIPSDDRGIRNESRPAVKKYIKKYCDDRGIKRSDIGIYADVRARVYYMGKEYPVNFDELKELAKLGVALIFIEKGGMVKVLNPYAQDYRLALCNTEGKLTEYAKELSELASQEGARVGVLVDYDLNGVLIAAEVKGAAWLGIDKLTIKRYNIPMPDPITGLYAEEVSKECVVPYESKKKPKAKEALYELQRTDPRFSKDRVDFDWLWTGEVEYIDDKTKRKKKKIVGNKIEINAVKVWLGSAKALWDYVVERMNEEWKTCDLRRVIDTDSLFSAPPAPQINFSHHSKVIDTLNNYFNTNSVVISKGIKQEFVEELKDFPGFPKVDELEREKRQEFVQEIQQEPEYEMAEDVISTLSKPILSDLEARIDEKTIDREMEIAELYEQIEDLQEEMAKTIESEVEQAEREHIIPALERLVHEKDYRGLVDALGLDSTDTDRGS